MSESCGFREFSLDPSPATYGVSVESFQFRMTLRAETTRMIRPFKTIRRRFHLLPGEALYGLRAGQSPFNDVATAIECLQLEPRILMSASPVAVVADIPDAAVETADASGLKQAVADEQPLQAMEAPSDVLASEQNESTIQASVELV